MPERGSISNCPFGVLFVQVWDRIYVGSMEAAADLEALKAANVTAVIDISRRSNPRFRPRIQYLGATSWTA